MSFTRRIENRPVALVLALLVVILGCFVALAARAATTGEEPQDPPKQHYVVLFDKGPEYVATREPTEQLGFAEHARYVHGLHAEGVVPLAGPLFEDDQLSRISGVLYFVHATGLDEARAVAMKEPLVQRKVLSISSIRVFLEGVGTLDR